NAIKGDIEKCFEAGMTDYVSKPIAFNDLEAKLRQALVRGSIGVDVKVLHKLDEIGGAMKPSLSTQVAQIFFDCKCWRDVDVFTFRSNRKKPFARSRSAKIFGPCARIRIPHRSGRAKNVCRCIN
ncbi:MAG: hypothetical protein V4692_08160, partial [Bdellovibrionota bacterium]